MLTEAIKLKKPIKLTRSAGLVKSKRLEATTLAKLRSS